MPHHGLDVIAFDGDDTLWHNERSFREGRERFRELLERSGVSLTNDEVDEHVNRTEVANLAYYGYGVSSFVMSLIETAIDLTNGRVSGSDLRQMIDLAKHMLTEDIELFPHAREVLTGLAASHPLMLVTKGDLLHQRSKLERSGLRECFRFVEVVSHKTVDVYSEIMQRHRLDPDRFLMIGNALRSDVLPVLEAGGWAVYVPASVSWSHEDADLPSDERARFFEITGLDRLPPVVERIENGL